MASTQPGFQQTCDLAIIYQHDTSATNALEPFGYANADWGNDLDNRCSIAGQIFLIAGRPVTWSSCKQHTVTKSLMQAEYMAASTAASEIAWLRTLLVKLGFSLTGPTILHVDNKSAIASANTQISHACTKHIDIHYHFLRKRITSHDVTVIHCTSKNNLANTLTKALPRLRFQALVAHMGMHA